MILSNSYFKYKLQIKALVFLKCLLLTTSLHANSAWVHDNLSKATDTYASNMYAFDKCRAYQDKPFNDTSKSKKAIIIGDSQGCDFLNGALENGYLRDYQIQFHFIPYPCQTVPGEYISEYISPEHRAFCTTENRIDDFENIKKQAKEANLVIFASLWKIKVAEKLPQIIHYLQLTKQQRLVVVGNKFFGKLSLHQYFHMNHNELRALRNDVGTKSMEINSVLRRKSAGMVIFIDPHKLVCGDNSTSCPIFTNNLRLISYDGRHLTKEGAQYIGRILFNNSPLKNI